MKKYIVIFALLLLYHIAHSQAFNTLRALEAFEEERYDRIQQDFRNMYVGENAKADAELDMIVSLMTSYTLPVLSTRVEIIYNLNVESAKEAEIKLYQLSLLCVITYLNIFSEQGMPIGDGKILFSDLFKYYMKATGNRNKGRTEMFSDMFRVSAEWGFIRYVDRFCVNMGEKLAE